MKKNGGMSKGGELGLVLRHMGLKDGKEGRVGVKIRGGGKYAMNRKTIHLECLGANEKMVWFV